MCAISGLIDFSHSMDAKTLLNRVKLMGEEQNLRGPDGCGQFVDSDTYLAIDHRRLAVIDLTKEGHQPMVSHSSRYVISFNGEIYNYRDLREELEKEDNFEGYRGHSDTEVLLTLIDKKGLENALKKISGMFAFALYDKKQKKLFLARDRAGEKPLFYGTQGSNFFFASELKGIMAIPEFKKEIDFNSVSAYLRYNYIPAPFSIFKGVKSLEAGTFIEISANGKISNPKRYWSLKDCTERGQKNIFNAPDEQITETLEELLLNSIEREMIADVPLGAFLSGGIDSSLIVALMQECALSPVKTFTIGFNDPAYNEAIDSKKVANHIGTDHHELYVSDKDLLDIIPQVPQIWDQPFADSSQIPTYLVSKMTKNHVTVALSGDGGDELFAGYNRHVKSDFLWNKIENIPAPCRSIIANILRTIPSDKWDAAFDSIGSIFPTFNVRLAGQKVHKLASVMKSSTKKDYYRSLISNWQNPDKLMLKGEEYVSPYFSKDFQPETSSFCNWMQFMDSATYLCDDILTKVDRAAMAVSLETRAPFLDHEIIEFSHHLPHHLKIKNGQGKFILRKILDKYVPNKLTNRPKMGFGIPIGNFLKTGLREWAEELLSYQALCNQPYFDANIVRQVWHEHLTGKKDHQYKIWNILVFLSWTKHWKI